jgi:ubiquinone/menaquinone biosynthesis C-methylase UbiE
MAANYDNAAWFYDRISQLVFGNQLLAAQKYLLSFIPPRSRILIAGGGTGSILDEITQLHPSSLFITYVEISANMTALSQKRNTGQNQITFITAPVEQVPPVKDAYDVILTPFLLDNFADEELSPVFRHLDQQLKAGGLWLCADFQLQGRWWQSLLLKTMYRFFKLLGCVQVSRLPDIESTFAKYQYSMIALKTFYGGFIKSVIYQATLKS